MSDAALGEEIKPAIPDSPFSGAGHRKIWARLRYKGIRASKARGPRPVRKTGLAHSPVGAPLTVLVRGRRHS